MLCHESGEFISSVCSSPVSKQDAQGIGSAITYLRRYSLAAMCGIAQEDDDGHQAVAPAPQQQRQSAPTPKRKLSNDEREICVKDMKAAPDLNALQEVVKGSHALAKSVDDKESIAFFNDCYKECAAAFAD
jgi:hypothetical protein